MQALPPYVAGAPSAQQLKDAPVALVVYACRVLPNHMVSQCSIVEEKPKLTGGYEIGAERVRDRLNTPAGSRPVGSTVLVNFHVALVKGRLPPAPVISLPSPPRAPGG